MVNLTLSAPVWTEQDQCNALVASTEKHKGHSIFVFAQLIYVVPSMMFIKFLLVALLCGKNSKKRYSSIFYTFITWVAWTAVLTHLYRSVFEFIGKRPSWFCPTFRSLNQWTYTLDIYVYSLQVWDTLRILVAALIVLYRFHSLLDIEAAKKLWEPKKARILLVLFAIPLIIYIPIWFTPSHAIIEDAEMVFINQGFRWYNKDIIHCVVCLICAAAVIASEIYLLKTGKRAPDSIEYELDVIGKVEIVVISIYAFFQGIHYFVPHRWYDAVFPNRFHYISLLVSDALGFAPLWALYMISKHIREDATPFRSLFVKCCGKKEPAQKEIELENKLLSPTV